MTALENKAWEATIIAPVVDLISAAHERFNELDEIVQLGNAAQAEFMELQQFLATADRLIRDD